MMHRTVVEGLWEAIEAHADRTALVDGPTGGSVTYGELGRRVGSIAGWLRGDGVGPGDRVALWAPNAPAVGAFAFAAFQVGAAVTPIGTGATDREAAAQLRDAAARVVVAAPSLATRARALGAARVIALGRADGAVSLEECLAAAPAAVEPGPDPAATALLPYSSGTTGLPKGVVLTHANLAAGCAQTGHALGVEPRDVTLAIAPYAHILGFVAELLVPLVSGATVVTMPRFEPGPFLDLLERHRITYLAVPPPIAMLLAELPLGDRDLSSLELLGCGGAPLPVSIHQALARRLPGCAVGQGYGLTETSGAISLPTRPGGTRPGTVGRPLPSTEIRAVDPETLVDVPAGADGELWVRGPQVMAGYLDRPDATAAMFADGGWLRTGDLGHVEPDGSLVLVDRLKELIKVNALQVAPAEVEAALLEHPDIADAGVVGRPHPRKGEVPIAFVVARRELDRPAIDAWLADRLAAHKRPAEIHVVAELPRTCSGKLRRELLRRR